MDILVTGRSDRRRKDHDMLERLLEAVRANRWAAISGAVITLLGLAAGAVLGLPPPFMLGLVLAFGLTTWRIYRVRSRHLDKRPARAPRGALISSGLAALVVVSLAAQAVPYGRDHSNPPINGEPDWATPQTRELVVRACFDCHSNEAVWPWYSNIAPISWAVWKHVKDGRNAVNYQEWDRPQEEADESVEEVEKGSMPPPYYTFGGLHSEGNLSAAELTALLDGLASTPGLSE
jgi:hypothetical protein